jgi:RND family efflux transporter MFP subunit
VTHINGILMIDSNEKQRSKACSFSDAVSSAGLVLLIAFLAACNRGGAQGSQAPPPSPVKVQAVREHEVGDSSEYVATIKSRHSATIMSDVEGWIFAIHVKSGQFVRHSDTLMEIDPRRQRATVSSQESQRASKVAAMDLAKVQLDRAKALSASGVMSKQEFDQAQQTYDSAVADVKSMDAQVLQQEVQLKYYSVFAPTDGIVGDVPVHVGDRVTNTTMLTTIDERKGLEVYISIPSERAHEIKMGAPVDVVDSTGNVLLRTKVYFISPQIDTGTQSVLVKAPADQADNALRSMQLVRARITWSTRPGITVPVVAVSRLSGQYFAFVVEQQDGKPVAHQRPLQLGEITGNDYVVLKGLKAGDQVVVSGGQNLTDGAPVRIEQ